LRQVKIALVGAGLMAEEHIRAFRAVPNVKISGIHSRTSERAAALAERYNIPSVCDSVDDLYRETKADLVVVAVPELQSREVCDRVFQYPWCALIEKPVGYNLTDAREIASEADRAERMAFVGLNRRHYGSTRAVLQEVMFSDEERLVHIFDQQSPKAALAAGRPSLVVDNWMYANSIHIIDYLRLFCRGDILEIDHVIKWNPENPRFILVKLHYSSGDIAIYNAVWDAPGPWSVSVTTQEKLWEMRPLERATIQVYGSRDYKSIGSDPWDEEFKPGLRFQAEEAVKAARGEPNCLPSLKEGLMTMELVKSIYGV